MMSFKLSSYLRLVRVPNLLIIAFMQFKMKVAVIDPILQSYNIPSSSGFNLLLLILATVFTAAGGYVLNDYFDVRIDAVNKPQKQIVGKVISKKQAMLLYQVLTFAGVVCGLLLSYLLKSFTLSFIFLMAPGLLWFYSSNYKRQFLIGNIVIAFNTALSVLIVAIAEVAFLSLTYGEAVFRTPVPGHIYGWLTGFSIFAFLLTLIREIIKDMEDIEGDREMECRTMPIKWGISKTKIVVYLLIILVMVGLIYVNVRFIPFEGNLTIRYIIFGLELPLLILAYMIFKAQSTADYHQASTLCKFIMLVGILYCFVFYYLQARTYGLPIFGLLLVQ